MAEKYLRSWKKVFESDLSYVVSELKETLERPALILLTGELGSGKTTFSKIFIGQSTTGPVQSPTYQLINDYPGILHADFYRLEKGDDLQSLELNLYLENKEFLLIEWGKKYLSFFERECDERFKIYEVTIEINKNGDSPSRHYHLQSIDRQM